MEKDQSVVPKHLGVLGILDCMSMTYNERAEIQTFSAWWRRKCSMGTEHLWDQTRQILR